MVSCNMVHIPECIWLAENNRASAQRIVQCVVRIEMSRVLSSEGALSSRRISEKRFASCWASQIYRGTLVGGSLNSCRIRNILDEDFDKQ